MNAKTQAVIVNEEQLPTAAEPEQRTSNLSLMLGADAMESALRVADLMANSKVTVPKHLQGEPGDCMAIVLQSMVWGMNPFVVAQKTHIVSGALGYEAQLVNAVVQSSGLIHGSFKYEYQGEGDSLECRVGAVLRGDSEVTFNEWLLFSKITTKNSPLWKTNPKQQLGYLQVKNWARAYTPGAILGVYTADELEQIPNKAAPKQINAVEEKPEPTYSDERFGELYVEWEKAVAEGKKTATQLIAFIAQTKVLSDEQSKKLDELEQVKVKANEEAEPPTPIKKKAAKQKTESEVAAEIEIPEGKRLNSETGELEDIPGLDEAPY